MALTKVSSLKVGESWISKKAKEELCNITEDITISDLCDAGRILFPIQLKRKAKWIFNKLKGKRLKTLPDLLREYNLPSGLFPQNVTYYEFEESKAS